MVIRHQEQSAQNYAKNNQLKLDTECQAI